jgi:hypothetical protein
MGRAFGVAAVDAPFPLYMFPVSPKFSGIAKGAPLGPLWSLRDLGLTPGQRPRSGSALVPSGRTVQSVCCFPTSVNFRVRHIFSSYKTSVRLDRLGIRIPRANAQPSVVRAYLEARLRSCGSFQNIQREHRESHKEDT